MTIPSLTAADRLDDAVTGVAGHAVYGRHTGAAIVVSIKANTQIGASTTVWLNTDQNTSTGYRVWGFAAGAERNVNVGGDGIPRLYSGGAGEALIGPLEHAYAENGTVLTVAVPTAPLGSPSRVAVYIDINDSVFLPTDYSLHVWTISRPAGVSVDPPRGLSRPALRGVAGR